MNFNIKKNLFNNLNIRQTILKNTFWLSVSLGISKFLGLIILVYAAKVLGAEEYGRFTFALSFVSLFVIFYSFGLPSIIIREFAREEDKKKEFYSIISLQLLLTFVCFGLILLTSFFVVADLSILNIILLLALFSLVNGLITIFFVFLQSQQKMEYEAILYIFQSLLMLLVSMYILFKLPSAKNLSYAYLISAVVALVVILFFFHFKVLPLKVKFDFFVWKKFLTMSWPLAITGLFSAVYHHTDSVMMGYWQMMTEVGWYNAAHKIALFGLIPAGLISGSFYPALSKFSKDSKDKFQKIYNYQMEVMVFLALPLIVGGIVLASKIIYVFYPLDFAPAGLAFQILILTTGIIFIHRPFFDVLVSLNHQRKIFWITLSGALFNVVLNVFLIPKYSLYGAAFATFLTNILILLILIGLVKKITLLSFPVKRILLTVLFSVFSAILMYFVIKQLIAINIFILVLIGVIIYFATFLFSRKYVLLKYFSQIYNV